MQSFATETQLNWPSGRTRHLKVNNINPFLLLFKALLIGQRDRIFFQWAFHLNTKTREL
jgi:hypothetical protein